jgi:hypothetical protein
MKSDINSRLIIYCGHLDGLGIIFAKNKKTIPRIAFDLHINQYRYIFSAFYIIFFRNSHEGSSIELAVQQNLTTSWLKRQNCRRGILQLITFLDIFMHTAVLHVSTLLSDYERFHRISKRQNNLLYMY